MTRAKLAMAGAPRCSRARSPSGDPPDRPVSVWHLLQRAVKIARPLELWAAWPPHAVSVTAAAARTVIRIG
jgi:hypothetical protein